MKLVLHTTVDITNTNIKKNIHSYPLLSPQEYEFQRNQQRNFDTLVQILGLRSTPDSISSPTKMENMFEVIVEYHSPIDINLILDDFDNIPVVPDLSGSSDDAFHTKDSINIYEGENHVRGVGEEKSGDAR